MLTRLFALLAILLVVFGAGAFYIGFVHYQKATPTLPAVVPKDKKYVALTFDDGPYGPPTEQILKILNQYNVRATFFLMGSNVEKYPLLTKQIVGYGNVIGNHSEDHSRFLPVFTRTRLAENLAKAETSITKATGLRPLLFRPPYGNASTYMLREIESEGYTVVVYTVDPRDWDYAHSPASQIVEQVVRETVPGSIILLHDGRDTQLNYPRDNTITALPEIITKLQAQGYEFVTVDKLLQTPAYKI